MIYFKNLVERIFEKKKIKKQKKKFFFVFVIKLPFCLFQKKFLPTESGQANKHKQVYKKFKQQLLIKTTKILFDKLKYFG